MRRCRAGTVSKAQRRAVVLGTSASTAEASQVLYCSGGRRIPSLRDGEVLVLPGRHNKPLRDATISQRWPSRGFDGIWGQGMLW